MQTIGDVHRQFHQEARAEKSWRSAYKIYAQSKAMRRKVQFRTRAALVRRLRQARRIRQLRTLEQGLQEAIEQLGDELSRPTAATATAATSSDHSSSASQQTSSRQQVLLRLAKAEEYMADVLMDLKEPATAAQHYGASCSLVRQHQLPLPLITLTSAQAYALLCAKHYADSIEAYSAELNLRGAERFLAEDSASWPVLRLKQMRELTDAWLGRSEARLALGLAREAEQDAAAAAKVLQAFLLQGEESEGQRPIKRCHRARFSECLDKHRRATSLLRSAHTNAAVPIQNADDERFWQLIRLLSRRRPKAGGGTSSSPTLGEKMADVDVANDFNLNAKAQDRGMEQEEASDDNDDQEEDEEEEEEGEGEEEEEEEEEREDHVPGTESASIALASLLPSSCAVREWPEAGESGGIAADSAEQSDATSIDLTDSDPEREAREALRREQRERAKLIKRNELGETPLQQAARKGQTALVQQLLQKGAPVNSHDHAGWTPLHDAVRMEHFDIVELLLACPDIAVNSRSNQEQHSLTPLHDAAEQGNVAIVAALLAAGADTTLEDARGHTPLDLAAAAGHQPVLDCFRSHLQKARQTVPWASLAEYVSLRAAEKERAKEERQREQQAAQPGNLSMDTNAMLLSSAGEYACVVRKSCGSCGSCRHHSDQPLSFAQPSFL